MSEEKLEENKIAEAGAEVAAEAETVAETEKVAEVAAETETVAEVEEKKESIFKELLSWIAVIGFAIVAAYLLNTFVIVNANVPTGSMENTIPEKSRIIGFRFSYWFSDPERGDIMVFEAPDEPDKNYVKRVIGLPGEKVRIEKAKIYITPADGGKEWLLEEDYLKEEWIVMNDGFNFEVPEGCYLMLGDNRNASSDARYWSNTYVKKNKIIGKAVLCLYPKLDILD